MPQHSTWKVNLNKFLMGLKFNESDVELFLLQQNMWQEIVKVFKPFVAFLKLYDVNQVYNMIAIMLDP